MKDFKADQHVSRDPNQEIQTWKNREAVLARGEDEEETDEDESTSMADSPKQAVLRESSKQVEPEVWIGDMAKDAGPKEPVDPMVSQDDITKLGLYLFFYLYIFDDCASSKA